MPLLNFLLMNMYTYNSKIPPIAYKKLLLNLFKETFPILKCWSNNSDNVIIKKGVFTQQQLFMVITVF
jgi:hypothetical protein